MIPTEDKVAAFLSIGARVRVRRKINARVWEKEEVRGDSLIFKLEAGSEGEVVGVAPIHGPSGTRFRFIVSSPSNPCRFAIEEKDLEFL